MKALEHKISPPIIMLITMGLMWLVSDFGFYIEFGGLIQKIFIVLLIALGIVCGLSGVLSFRKAATTIDPHKPEKTTSLVTFGIYNITRNPMYIGLLSFLLAWGIYLSSLLAFCCIPAFILYINRFQILPEERVLQKKFGDKFIAYKSNVRRWL